MRLRIVEPDGKVRTGPVATLKDPSTTLSIKKIWTDAASLHAQIQSPILAPAAWMIIDPYGRQLYRGSQQLQKGSNYIQLPMPVSSGSYRFVIQSNGSTTSRPLLHFQR